MSLLDFLMTPLVVNFISIGSKGPATKAALIRFLARVSADMVA
jgi:hypothetical protein